MKVVCQVLIASIFIAALSYSSCYSMSPDNLCQSLKVEAYSSYSATCQDVALIENVIASTSVIVLENVTGKTSYKIVVMDWATGKTTDIVSVQDYVEQHALSKDNKKLIICAGKKIMLYDVISKHKIHEFDYHEAVKKATLSDDGKQLFVVSEASVTIFNLTDGQQYTVSTSNGCFALNGSQNRLFVSQGATVKKYAIKGFYCFKKYMHESPVVSIDCSTDARCLLTCDDSGIVRIWDAEKEILLKELPRQSKKYTKAIFCCDNTCILAVTDEYKIDILSAIDFAPKILSVGGKYYDFQNPYLENNALISYNDPYNIAVAAFAKPIT